MKDWQQLSQEEKDTFDAKIKQKLTSTINEHAAKHAILRITHSPEHANLTVKYLTSIDWQEVFLEQERSEEQQIARIIRETNETYLNGGGYCDECRKEHTRLYYWPYSSSEPPEIKNPIELLPKRKEMTEDNWLMMLQAVSHDYLNPPWYSINRFTNKRLCRRCLFNNRTYERIPYDDCVFDCDICKRLVRRHSLYRIEIEYSKRDRYDSHEICCCLHCIEKVIEKQFVFCIFCGKKTKNGLSGDTCFDCKIDDPYTTSISFHLDRARKAGNPATLTAREWITTVIHFNSTCAYCRTRPFEVLEHFLPISLGGGTTADNCVPACVACNTKKGKRHPDTLCYQNTLFGPTLLPPQRTDFILEHIEDIKQYLQSEKPLFKPLPKNDRSLVVYR